MDHQAWLLQISELIRMANVGPGESRRSLLRRWETLLTETDQLVRSPEAGVSEWHLTQTLALFMDCLRSMSEHAHAAEIEDRCIQETEDMLNYWHLSIINQLAFASIEAFKINDHDRAAALAQKMNRYLDTYAGELDPLLDHVQTVKQRTAN